MICSQLKLNLLDYKGYVEVDILLHPIGSSVPVEQYILALVVPDTPYNHRIPSNIHLESSVVSALCQPHQVPLSPLLESICMLNTDIDHNQKHKVLKMFDEDDSLEHSGMSNSD